MLNIDLSGKKYLVMGVANKRSLGWAIADQLRAAGAELAFTYQAERLRADLEKLTADIPGALLYQADVTNEEELERAFAALEETWGVPVGNAWGCSEGARATSCGASRR